MVEMLSLFRGEAARSTDGRVMDDFSSKENPVLLVEKSAEDGPRFGV